MVVTPWGCHKTFLHSVEILISCFKTEFGPIQGMFISFIRHNICMCVICMYYVYVLSVCIMSMYYLYVLCSQPATKQAILGPCWRQKMAVAVARVTLGYLFEKKVAVAAAPCILRKKRLWLQRECVSDLSAAAAVFFLKAQDCSHRYFFLLTRTWREAN